MVIRIDGISLYVLIVNGTIKKLIVSKKEIKRSLY